MVKMERKYIIQNIISRAGLRMADMDSGNNRARRENRPANGTLTLRRTSATPFAQTSQGEVPSLSTSTADVPGVLQSSHSSYEQPANRRLSKETLLQIYRSQEESGAFNSDVSELYANGWNPGHTSATNGRSGWGKVNDGRDNHGPDVCWNINGDVRPVGFEEMTEEEKTVCYTLLWIFMGLNDV
jgi:PERQ amino acid-rich with GYF domain-containing protein